MKRNVKKPIPSDLASTSSIEAWQRLLSYLLKQHFGLNLSDTPFIDREVIRGYIDAGIPLTDAVNFMVDHMGLIRIDGTSYLWQKQTSYISAVDILEAMRVIDI